MSDQKSFLTAEDLIPEHTRRLLTPAAVKFYVTVWSCGPDIGAPATT
jgi:hypothetical protein